ncbi:uncharacterized protein J7T54_006350 [Emericellopsis cladophorae]|uniref:DOMON domain-containing protein n=1 Tax=Emericellopsis cladophorae TaxID=2686198 RepID=A0A9P9Y9L7_9HYPO|nr:uncharacterized protein J7T54_006350 [Emericellopsis cladophorae]KAI6786011.1 hypothetical protein J7T54_006350 [Emericellopsis cladophorae]
MQLFNYLPVALLAYATGIAAAPDHDSGDHSSATDGDSADFTPAVNCRNDICYSAVVPEATASSDSGPIWFQIYAPTKFAWVALGTGSTMSDANMFIIYQDGDGNVTLSHRQASGHTMPQVPANSPVTTTLLPGTGVSDGFMVANFRCDNCTTWKSGESLDFSSAGTPMIGAWQEGDPLDSTDVEARIGKHTGSPRIFSLDLSSAIKATAGNPFVDDFAVPEEANDGGSEDADAEDDSAGDGADGESAGVGRSSLVSGGVAAAAMMMGFSLLM